MGQKTYEKNYDIVRKEVQKYIQKNMYIFDDCDFVTRNKSHIVDTGVEILMGKWKLLPQEYLGSFTEAVLNNDLMRSFSQADDINRLAMLFFVMLIENVGMPSQIVMP
jgi:hypothetical protein